MYHPQTINYEQLNPGTCQQKRQTHIMHIGEAIKKELERQGKTVTWFAEQIPCHRSNVYRIFEKHSIDTNNLMQISRILQHNFFADLTEELNARNCR